MGSFVPNVLNLKLAEPTAELLHVIWDPLRKAAKHNKAEDAWAALDDDDDSQGGEDDDEEVAPEKERFGEEGRDFGKYDPKGIPEEEEGCDGQGLDDVPIELEVGADDSSSGASVRELAERIDIDLEEAGEAAEAGSPAESSSSDSSSSLSSSSSSSGSSDESDEEASGWDAGPEVRAVIGDHDNERGPPRGYIRLAEKCTMTFFELGSRRDFIVRCNAHKSCVLTRTANASNSKG